MLATALMVVCCWQASPGDANVCMMQVYPPHRGASNIIRSKEQTRAVILLQGLDLRDDDFCPTKPRFQPWQGSTSELVKSLSGYADVFSISYAQTTSVEDVAHFAGLRHSIKNIKALGYKRVIVVGHSAGGLVARYLIEDYPDTEVDMVIAVATPNGGCKIADWSVRLRQCPKGQGDFIQSLSYSHRQEMIANRRNKKIPARIEFVILCSCTSSKATGDSVVSCKSQWTRDLQLQRIPCICTYAKHNHVTRNGECIEAVRNLVRDGQPRWSRRQVFQMRKWMGMVPE